MQSVNCGGVVSARAEMLLIIYKEFLSHLGEAAAGEKAEQHETLKSRLVKMNKQLFRRPGKLILNAIFFPKWYCNICFHTLISMSSKIYHT